MIRLSIKEDLPSLLTLSESIGLFPPEHLDALAEMLDDYFGTDSEEERFWLTDLKERRAVGIVFCEPEQMTNGTWNLRLIGVSPELQRQGRGLALLNFVEAYLLERGARLLIVDTSGTVEFKAVREFYRRCGYTEATRIPDFFDKGDDKITFTKLLANRGQ